MNYKAISISKYINTDSNEVLCFKITGRLKDPGENYLRAFIKTEEIWSEIKADQSLELSEQVKVIS